MQSRTRDGLLATPAPDGRKIRNATAHEAVRTGRVRHNFENNRIVNPTKKHYQIHASIYALDTSFKAHKVGEGAIIKGPYGHTYWRAGRTQVPVHKEGNRWVLSTKEEPGRDSGASINNLIRKHGG